MDADSCIHNVQHTFVSRLIEAGADPKTAAELAGHTDRRETRGIYTHPRDAARKKALLLASNPLDSLLAGKHE